jgi:hypothetical protein
MDSRLFLTTGTPNGGKDPRQLIPPDPFVLLR